jgi:hypothetical protein
MARRRARSSHRRGSKRSKGFPTWLLLGGAAAAAYFLFASEGTASAAENPPAPPPPPGPGPGPSPTPGPGPSPTPGPGPCPSPNPPTPTPSGGITPGTYMVTTNDTGPSGDLMLRAAPSTSAAIVEHLPHGISVRATGDVNNGFAAVVAPDGQSGWAALIYLTYEQ